MSRGVKVESGLDRTLRALVIIAYLGIGALAIGSAAPVLRKWALVIQRPAVYFAELPSPWLWAALSGVVLVTLFLVVRARILGERANRTAAGLFLTASCILVFVAYFPRPASPLPTPAVQLGAALALLQNDLAAFHEREGRYPEQLPEDGVRMPDGTRVWTAYWGRGKRIPFRLVTRTDETGAALRALDGDGPGTIYYVVSPDGGHYWLTALLMHGQPVGPVRFARRSDDTVVVAKPEKR